MSTRGYAGNAKVEVQGLPFPLIASATPMHLIRLSSCPLNTFSLRRQARPTNPQHVPHTSVQATVGAPPSRPRHRRSRVVGRSQSYFSALPQGMRLDLLRSLPATHRLLPPLVWLDLPR